MARSSSPRYLTLGAASAWAAREQTAFKDYVLITIPEDEVEKWDFEVNEYEIEWKCEDEGGCIALLDSRKIAGNQNITYTCDEDAKIRILFGILVVPADCDGALVPYRPARAAVTSSRASRARAPRESDGTLTAEGVSPVA